MGYLFVQAVFEGVKCKILIIIGKFASSVEPRLGSLKSVVPRLLILVGICQEYVQSVKSILKCKSEEKRSMTERA